MMHPPNRRKSLRRTGALIALSALESLGYRRLVSAAKAPVALTRPKSGISKTDTNRLDEYPPYRY